MLDPISIIGVATTAFNGLKAAVQAGKELEECIGQLNQWAGAISDLDKADSLVKKKKSSLFRSLLPTNGKSTQQQAMEIFVAKRTAMKQREELRQLIQYTAGEHGWHDFLRIEAKVREERQKAVYAEIERVEKLKDMALSTVVVVLAILSVVGIVWLGYAISNTEQ